MAKLKPIPMPIEAVLDSRHLKFTQGAVYRAVIVIACQFWAGGSRLDGFNEPMAAQLSRIPYGNWNAIKQPVMSALADILPELATRYASIQATRNAMRAMLSANGKKGRAISLARRRALNQPAPEQNTSTARVALKTPQVAAKYVNPRACMAPQTLAALPSVNVETARFLDK